MSDLGLIVGVVVSRLLIQNWIAPSVDGAWLEEVLASFEFDRELLFRSLKTLVSGNTIGEGGCHYLLLSHSDCCWCWREPW
jgi:hypothetical protein